jgi:hypothetical protein
VKIPPKKFLQRKMPGKKFVQPLRQRKKIRASKQQSTNSLEIFVPQKFYTPPPPGISNGPPLTTWVVNNAFQKE